MDHDPNLPAYPEPTDPAIQTLSIPQFPASTSTSPTTELTPFARHLTLARSYLLDKNPDQALVWFDSALAIYKISHPNETPSSADLLLSIASTCLVATPPNIQRACQTLHDIYTNPNTDPPTARCEAAHRLVQMYFRSSENTRDRDEQYDSISVSQMLTWDKVKEYCICAVEGRQKDLGLQSEETQESIELLTGLIERAEMGDSSGSVLDVEDLLGVLKSTFGNG
ncbi:hypothetical protein P154DRAFT_104764 [Amniculicola lignicola CBS 123094]|uniref:Uncharacterized protein n=1 Tax=Amniculicola lignicola CBS 123094 TaxID=1392246 RepID=A0A6A5WR18_9PLEO|nr:hypothetical protein P154DRAFT_104764 [Amniculicola lignicola CBS 123094]